MFNIGAIVPENLSDNKARMTFMPPDMTLDVAHIYGFIFDDYNDLQEYHWDLLDEDEQARANQFVFPHHRERFITAHGVLREILAHYTGIAADKIKYCTSERGKPSLHPDLGCALQFNLSHADHCAAVALSWHHALGVDIEALDSNTELASMAQRFFAPEEAAQICAFKGQDQMHAFYRLWTLKEALLKATGSGITNGLDAWVFELKTPLSAQLKSAPIDVNDTEWSFFQHELPALDCLLAAALPCPNVRWKLSFVTATHS